MCEWQPYRDPTFDAVARSEEKAQRDAKWAAQRRARKARRIQRQTRLAMQGKLK